MTKPSETEDLDVLDQLVERFASQRRAGSDASIEEFISQHPRWRDELNELLPAVSFLDQAISSVPPVTNNSKDFPAIHDYQFVRELGRGGMGVVYQAEHLALGRQVAVKVLSLHLVPNEKARIRFQREARAAARMHHSNIVPVFEVGQSGKTSFYSMQLIEGENLDDHIKGLRESILERTQQQSVEHYRKVARLGVSIARALQYAHDQQVLHRDIKPSNVLIDLSQTAWLSDFGLASISDERVANTEELVGTLRYLAPERLAGKCDERSDVYSLGLTLYEYATLRPAFESKDRAQLLHLNRQCEPLGKSDPAVPADLATVIEKAMMADANYRYQSAVDLANDLQSFLEHKPIAARRVSPLERLWMWSKRNPQLATLTITINVLLVASAIGSAIAASHFSSLNKQANAAKATAIELQRLAEANAIEAEKQAWLAEQNEDVAKRVASFFSRMVQGADPSGLFSGHERSLEPIDQSTTAFQWIVQSAKLIDHEDFSDSPHVEAQIKDTLGVALTGQMRMNEAEPLLERSLELRRKLLAPDHPDVVRSIHHLGTFHFYRGDSMSAAKTFREALAIQEQRLQEASEKKETAESVRQTRLEISRTQAALGLALAYSIQAWSEEAVGLLRSSLHDRRELLGNEHYEVAYGHIALASVLARAVRPEEALEHIRAAESILAKQGGDHRLTEVFSLYAQGTALQSAKQTDMAVDRFVKAEAKMNELLGPSHPLTVFARGEVAGALERGGRPEEAEAIYKRVIAFNETAMANQPFLGQSWETLGICLAGQGKHAESVDALREALRVYRSSGVPDGHLLTATCNVRLGLNLTGAGKMQEAFDTLMEATLALEQLPRETIGQELWQGMTHMAYLTMWHQYNRFPEVIEIVLRVGESEVNPTRLFHLLDAGTRGACTHEQAEALLAMSDRWLEKPVHDYDRLEALHFRGRVLYLVGRYDEAIKLLKNQHPNAARRYQAALFSGLCHKQKGNAKEAKEVILKEFEWLLPRIPPRMANYHRDLIGDPVTPDRPLPSVEPEVEFPWDQSAYAEFAWKNLVQ